MPRVRIAVGCHPHNAKYYDDGLEADLRRMLKDPRVAALGEIGLDYHYDFSPRDDQREAFRRQLRLAKEAGLPVALHLILPCRDQCRGGLLAERMRYDAILSRADSVRYVADAYTADCMRRRNDALVAAAGHCVCYLQRDRGGTAYTVRRARAAGLEIIHLMTADPVQTALPGTGE